MAPQARSLQPSQSQFEIEQSQFGFGGSQIAQSQFSQSGQVIPANLTPRTPKVIVPVGPQTFDKPMIQVAILLDDSGSMDGLIDQARSLIWGMVNGLTEAKKQGQDAGLEIALYHYGETPEQLEAFTDDLDEVSEALFALRTAGGDEYCGEVILKASSELGWSADPQDLKLIVIAGNEAFTQGSIEYSEGCNKAMGRAVVVNTVHCMRSHGHGTDTEDTPDWRKGAKMTGGTFTSIDQNKKQVDIEAPQDDDLIELNRKLNETFVSFTKEGQALKSRQLTQDNLARSQGSKSYAGRSMAKSGKYYSAARWDIVDAAAADGFDWSGIKRDALPPELRGLSDAELKAHVSGLAAKRKQIQADIRRVAAERQAYIDAERKRLQTEEKTAEEVTLESAFLEAARKIGRERGFTF